MGNPPYYPGSGCHLTTSPVGSLGWLGSRPTAIAHIDDRPSPSSHRIALLAGLVGMMTQLPPAGGFGLRLSDFGRGLRSCWFAADLVGVATACFAGDRVDAIVCFWTPRTAAGAVVSMIETPLRARAEFQPSISALLLDHLVGTSDQRRWY
jgi:hypothetical protein